MGAMALACGGVEEGTPAPASGTLATYRLIGDDLHQYLGHTVEVLGRAERADENDARDVSS